jgi:hypothetical protein
MQPFFLLVEASGSTVGVARGRPAAAPCVTSSGAAGGRRWPVGPAERPRPSGEGGNDLLESKEKGCGWAESPNGPAG